MSRLSYQLLAAQAPEVARRNGDYKAEDFRAQREELVRRRREANPDAANETCAAFDPLIMRLPGGSQADARDKPSVPAISPFMAIAHQPVRSANRGGHGVSRQWQDGRAAHRR